MIVTAYFNYLQASYCLVLGMASEKIKMSGHIIDSGALSGVLDAIVSKGGEFSIEKFDVGKTHGDISNAIIEVTAEEGKLAPILDAASRLGATTLLHKQAIFRPAPADFTYPGDFYSTTNFETWVQEGGRWKKIAKQRMDAVIVLDQAQGPVCKKFRDIKKGDLIACTASGIRTSIPRKDEKSFGFSFMSAEVSSEKSAGLAAKQLSDEMKKTRARGGKIIAVPGPAVVHTGGNIFLASMIRKGYISAVLSGNATAAHDAESSSIGTSLGISCQSGAFMHEGNRNHISAINKIFAAGSIAQAVENGTLKSGIFYECVKNGIPFSLAASIRDDGPLPGVITDMVAAQKDYARLLDGAELVLMLASTLHSVGVGNMLPAHVKTVCVDINPAVVTKLSDRGTWQAVGIVTDVGLFLKELDSNL